MATTTGVASPPVVPTNYQQHYSHQPNVLQSVYTKHFDAFDTLTGSTEDELFEAIVSSLQHLLKVFLARVTDPHFNTFGSINIRLTTYFKALCAWYPAHPRIQPVPIQSVCSKLPHMLILLLQVLLLTWLGSDCTFFFLLGKIVKLWTICPFELAMCPSALARSSLILFPAPLMISHRQQQLPSLLKKAVRQDHFSYP